MEDALPRFGVGNVDHSAKDSSVRRRAEDRRAQNPVEMAIGVGVIAQNQLLGGATETLADVGVEAALPVAVAERGCRRCDGQLVRYEVVVRNRIGGKVRQISESESAERLRLGVIVNLEADRPRMAVPAGRSILFRDTRIGGN